MARKLRVEYPGAIYHVMNRGDRREPIFKDDTDRLNFLDTLGEVCGKSGWQAHAYCLMANHFHLVIETPQPNLVAGMKWFMGTYTSRFNRRHKLFGHLFSGRYKSLLVDGSGNGYLKTGCDYVHLNPARAKLLRPEEPLRSYRWSSWPEYLRAPSRRPDWLRVDRLLGEYRISKESAAGRRNLEQQLESRRGAEDGAEYRSIRRGWCFGGESFRRELLEQVGEQIGKEHCGEERHENQIDQAEQLILETQDQGVGFASAEQRGSAEDRDCAALARGNDGDCQVDRRTASHGKRGLREQSALFETEKES
jgi:REP-associated tyrosine transposase